MDKDSPLVSIGMPVRNCQNTLALAIRSLLLQTFTNWELILIDDGSSDETLKVARSISDNRVKFWSDGISRGLADRLNQAIELSKGKYFARMDGDDVAYPERLERQVSYLEQHPDVDLVGAWAVVFCSDGTVFGKKNGPETHVDICSKPWRGFPIVHPSYVGRLNWFRRYGYRQSAIRCEDHDLLLRSYRFSRFAIIPEILLGYREERINLKKTFTGRRYVMRILFRDYRREQLGLVLRGVLHETFMSFADFIAVISGLNYRMLRHRALPILDSERREWKCVWRPLNQNNEEER